MRLVFILGLAGLLIGCQPSVEQQAERELAIEAEKQKIRDKENEEMADYLASGKDAIDYLFRIRSELEEKATRDAKNNLAILDKCESEHMRYVDKKKCYQNAIKK